MFAATTVSTNSFNDLTKPQTNGLTTDANTVIGQGAGDVITGTNATLNSTDIIIDAVADDGDVMTITATDDIVAGNAATVVGIETVNYTVQAFATPADGDNTFNVDSSGVTADNINLDVDQNGSSIVNANITGVATGTTVTASDDFTTAVTVTGDDNAAVTVNAAAATITADSAGALTGATITNSLSGASTLVTNSDAAATLTTTGGDMTITAATATSVTATSSGSIDANTTDIAAATTVNLTATDEVNVGLDAAVSATISAGGTTASTIDDVGANEAASTLTTLSLSGNGSAHTFDVRNSEGVNSITVTGDQDVTVGMSLADVSGLTTALTVTDSSSGTSTVVLDTADAGAATDLSGVAPDVIELGVANTQVLTLASGANLTVAASQAAGTLDGSDAGAATNTLAVALNDGDDTNTTGVDLSGVTLTDLASVTIDVSVDDGGSTITSLTGSADNTDVTIEAGANGVTLATAVDLGTGDLVINSDGTVALGTTGVTASAVTVAGAGDVTANINTTAGSFTSLTTDTGGDNITVNDATNGISIATGEGTDAIRLQTTSTSAGETYVFDLGDGNADIIELDNTVDLTLGTVTFSGAEFLEFVDTTTASTVQASHLDGASYIVQHETETDTMALTVAMGSANSLDLSNLVVNTATLTAADSIVVSEVGATSALTLTGTDGMKMDFTTGSGNDVITGGDVGDAITASGGDDTIDGGAGADTIVAGDGDDVITAGEGADQITIGTGADTVILTEDTSATDVVFVTTVLDGSADGVPAGTFSDFNTVTGFEAGVDEVSAANGIFTGVVTDVAGTAANIALNDLDASNYTSVDQVVNFISDLIAGANYTAGDAAVDLLTVTLGNDLTAIYAIDDAVDGVVDATEINLIGTVDAAILAADVVTA